VPIPLAIRQVERALTPVDTAVGEYVFSATVFGKAYVSAWQPERVVRVARGTTVLNGESSFVCGFHTSAGPADCRQRFPQTVVVVVLLADQEVPNAVSYR